MHGPPSLRYLEYNADKRANVRFKYPDRTGNHGFFFESYSTKPQHQVPKVEPDVVQTLDVTLFVLSMLLSCPRLNPRSASVEMPRRTDRLVGRGTKLKNKQFQEERGQGATGERPNLNKMPQKVNGGVAGVVPHSPRPSHKRDDCDRKNSWCD